MFNTIEFMCKGIFLKRERLRDITSVSCTQITAERMYAPEQENSDSCNIGNILNLSMGLQFAHSHFPMPKGRVLKGFANFGLHHHDPP